MPDNSMDQAYDSATIRLDAVIESLDPTANFAARRDLRLVRADFARFADLATGTADTPAAPANPLCSSDYPSDVINAAQSALRFMHDAKGDDADEEDAQFLEGRQWLWGMIHDALGYAKALTDQQQSAKAVQS